MAREDSLDEQKVFFTDTEEDSEEEEQRGEEEQKQKDLLLQNLRRPGSSSSAIRGLLEKRSSDGSWKTQLFSLKRFKLYYQDPTAKEDAKVASLDLADVVKVERSGAKLLLYVDEKRKHQLRAASGPSLEEWEDALRDRAEAAHSSKHRRSGKSPRIEQDDDEAHYRKLIVDFYRRTNPDKVQSVDTLIAKYRDIGVGEKDLLAAIQNKYDKIKMLR
eukprot:CAMPEP_0198658534 /NCGR_PEP_ID=MMETSP1467-20131203/26059_1 /TAXON_ID=1462469 /ORGANISM="unid. sp., Strain CCMP2135" /LENGTH=216 /DNA_ID=CAMNT_0044394809 /DNA_START=33 /DNA_END=683 /DNA_ORIENTATION=+